jgi:hypothetical protein
MAVVGGMGWFSCASGERSDGPCTQAATWFWDGSDDDPGPSSAFSQRARLRVISYLLDHFGESEIDQWAPMSCPSSVS